MEHRLSAEGAKRASAVGRLKRQGWAEERSRGDWVIGEDRVMAGVGVVGEDKDQEGNPRSLQMDTHQV